jgi:hypothetical protein
MNVLELKLRHVTDFHLIDLVSQREAVRQHLRDSPVCDILLWLAARGQLRRTMISGRETFFFETAVGRQAVFFFDGDEMIFFGDHTTFR